MLNTPKIANSYWPGFILFLMALVIGLSIYQDFGISWDEPIQRDMGTTSYKYVFQHDPYLLTYEERSHGVAFELPLIFLEKGLHLTDGRDIYLMRHLVTHLFFLVAVFFGYILCLRLFKDQFIACMGFILLAFHPRIYAHSFVNTKDIPFISALIIFFTLAHIAFDKKKTIWYLLMAVACAYATSIRAMGVLFAACISGFFIIDIITAAIKKEPISRLVAHFLLFVAVFCGFLWATWPILWTRPLFHFIEEFKALSHIYWHGFVLLNGINYPGEEIPWYYAPEWFSITMPILWLVSGIGGIIAFIIAFFKKPLRFITNTPERNFSLYFVCCVLPVAMVIALKSILYDDWRHLYFIYPSFVFLVLFAIHNLAIGKRRNLVIALCILQIGYTTVFMIRNHPYQIVYFNELVSHKPEYLKSHFDVDYWGCADKQAFEYILEHDKSDTIKVWNSLYPVLNNRNMIPPDQRSRILLTDSANATYFMTNFRNHPGDYPIPNIYHEIKVHNSTILRIYKLK